MNEKLTKLVIDAKEAGAKEALDAQTRSAIPEPHERKIRFCADGASLGHNNEEDGLSYRIKTNDLFRPKRDPEKYSLEDIALARMICAARGWDLPDNLESRFQSQADRIRRLTMTTGAVGEGAELVDTVLWPSLFNDVVHATLVAQLFAPWIDMPSQSVELPSLGDVTFYKPGGEGEAVAATNLATAKRTIKAYLLKAQVDISDEQDEDSIIALIPEIRSKLVRNGREVIDEAILCADSSTGATNINYYGATIPTTSRFLLGFDGLIHYALNEVTGNVNAISAALDEDDFITLLAHMGKYGVEPERVAFIVDIWNKTKMLGIDALQSVDQVGPRATLLTGQIGSIFGSPVIATTALAKSHASGYVHYSAGNTVGRVIAVNRDMWRFGMRRNIRVETERSAAKGVTSIVVTMRIGLQCFGDRSSADYTHTILGYNTTI